MRGRAREQWRTPLPAEQHGFRLSLPKIGEHVAVEKPRDGPLRAIIQQPAQLERRVWVLEPLRDLVELGDC